MFRNSMGNLVECIGSLVLSALDRMLLPHAIVLAKYYIYTTYPIYRNVAFNVYS